MTLRSCNIDDVSMGPLRFVGCVPTVVQPGADDCEIAQRLMQCGIIPEEPAILPHAARQKSCLIYLTV